MNDSSENVEAARLRKYIGLGLSEKRQVLAWVVFAVCFALAAVYGVNWWITAMNTVYIDEGCVTAAYATISAEVSGKIVKFSAEEGDIVR